MIDKFIHHKNGTRKEKGRNTEPNLKLKTRTDNVITSIYKAQTLLQAPPTLFLFFLNDGRNR